MIHKKPHFNEATTLALNKIQYTKVGRSMNGKKNQFTHSREVILSMRMMKREKGKQITARRFLMDGSDATKKRNTHLHSYTYIYTKVGEKKQLQ